MKNLSIRQLFLFLFALLSFYVSNARVYYVSSSYSGTVSNGSLTTPWKSLADVQANQGVFISGDTISFKKSDVFSGTLNISKSGSLGFPITYNSYGSGAKPKFIGTGNTISYLFYLYNKNYIVFDGLEITDPTLSLTDRSQVSKIQRAFGFDGTSSNNSIKNCTLSLVGVGTYWVGPNNTMDHCDIGNLRMVVNNVGGNNDYGANPIVISSANNTITNNYFHDCWANSYDYVYDGGAVEFYGSGSSNNIIRYNTFYDCNGVVENGSGNGGLIENNEFSYNKFINNGSLFYINNGGTYLVTVSNMKFYNNVIIENVVNRLAESSMGSMSTSVSNQGIVVFKNNVFELSNGVDVIRSGQWTGGQLVHENNAYKLSNSSYPNFTLNSNELSTSQIIWTNTSNSNPVLWDYTPTSSSQLINFGQNLGMTNDFLGNAISGLPDAGIIERQNSNIVSPLAVALSSTSILCNGEQSVVTVYATGGTPPYSGTGNFSVRAGTYSYTVTDINGLSTTKSIVVTEPAQIAINAVAGNISTYGGTTSLTVNTEGGVGPYYYQLNNGVFQTSNIFNNLVAGNYLITVKDQNNCTRSVNVNITQPSLLSVQISTTAISCNGDSSILIVTASGGVPPYQGTGNYSVAAGNYQYTVTDANGSTASSSIVITQPDLISLQLSSGIISVFGGSTSINVNVTGGIAPYQYAINNGSFQASNIFSYVTAGNYLITVKDVNGCMKNASISVVQPQTAPLNLILVTKKDVSCRKASDGYIEVAASGGTSPYSFSINNGTYSLSSKFYNLKPGTYTIKVKDFNNNIVQITVQIFDSRRHCYMRPSANSNSDTSITEVDLPMVSIYPNPSSEYFTLKLSADNIDQTSIVIYDVMGRKVFQSSYGIQKMIRFGNELKPGIYFVNIIMDNQMVREKIVKR